ncbi:uncharacterized protein LOC131619710 [Vicia villosa]|uniref:uncharacterized protein LOC131619710 n=1 Tax=Vicia villosa TaxID=3911 RepID=UPI00273A8A09|nr:uncharacterized protein LOC131619710 [Vicia villosa]
MASNFWVTRREITQNNGRTRPNEYENQISNNHLLSNTHFQTPQNPFTNLNNYNLGRYQNNTVATATPQPMVQFSFSSNNPSSFLTPVRYGRTLPLSSRNNPFIPSYLPNSSQNPSSNLGNTLFIPPSLPISSRISSSRSDNTPLISSNLPNSSRISSSISGNTSLIPSYPRNASQNSSSNGVTTRYRNSLRPVLHNQLNARYSPYPEGSNHISNINPLVLNDSNPRSRIELINYQGLEDIDMLNANPNNNNNNPLALNDCNPHSRIDLNNYQGHGNASFDSTVEHRVFNGGETDAWREPVTTSVVSFNETETQKKELLLFKDDKNTIPTRSVIEIDDSSDDEHLDLSLRL